ncbi:MAG: hypothetical protein HIU82_18585 [Proteobacteria bacterium]|nr:hypothetical protein [Pseudomonadota bacterium]
MDDNEIEITVGGGPGQAVADAADHIALALMSAGAAVVFPGRPRREAERARTLCGVRAVVRTSVGAQPGMLRGPSRAGFDLPIAPKVAVGAVPLLALLDAEVRLHFGLGLDTLVTGAAIWWFWRWRRQLGAAMPAQMPG